MLYAQVSGELRRVLHYSCHEMTPLRALALLTNGTIAFGLNVASFTANKKAGALSMTVAGMYSIPCQDLIKVAMMFNNVGTNQVFTANVKQVLTVLLAVAVFDLRVTWINGIGMLLTVMGGVWYAAVEYEEINGIKR
jgi:hypothetical protein